MCVLTLKLWEWFDLCFCVEKTKRIESKEIVFKENTAVGIEKREGNGEMGCAERFYRNFPRCQEATQTQK